MAGIYIHIPFCKKACHYCNFHFSTLDNHDELINTIIQEIEFNQKKFNKKNISTIYFGGGTPSLIKDIYLEKIIKKLYLKFKVNKKCEITLEANPDDISTKKLGVKNKAAKVSETNTKTHFPCQFYNLIYLIPF